MVLLYSNRKFHKATTVMKGSGSLFNLRRQLSSVRHESLLFFAFGATANEITATGAALGRN
jgi:hypothetical protein